MARERKGLIVERKGRIYARVTFTDQAGKRHDLMRRAESRSDARKLIKAILAGLEMTGKKSVEGDRLTFRCLAETYKEQKLIPAQYHGQGDGLRKVAGLRSWRTPQGFLRVLVANFGNMRVKEISHSDIERFKLMRLQTLTRYKRSRTVAAVNRELEVMRAVMRFAYRQGYILRSPFDASDPLISKADEMRRERVLSHDEERRLLGACRMLDKNGRRRRLHLCAMIICALDTALRKGEILKLIWRDVDFDSGIIIIRAMNSKTTRARSVAMTPRLYDELIRLWRESDFNLDGSVFNIKDNVKNSFMSACRDADVCNFRFHDCRHTAITRMVAAGIPAMEIMKVSGHTQMTTFARYVNPTEQTVRRAAERLALFNAEAAEVPTVIAETIN